MKEFNYKKEHFDLIRELVHQHAGIKLSDEKLSMVYGRLTKIIRELKLTDFDQYCTLIKRDEPQLIRMIDAITTNVTHFFRENHHFEYLTSHVVPEIIASGQRGVKVWSAGCSTGQEPYCISVTLQDDQRISGYKKEIFATDLSDSVLETAVTGVYDSAHTSEIPMPVLKKWFLKSKTDARFKVKPELQSIIQFNKLNLMKEWAIPSMMDVIFCRNVMIYFNEETQTKLVNRFADKLKPSGYLFVGHSENITKLTDRYELVGKSMYRRIS